MSQKGIAIYLQSTKKTCWISFQRKESSKIVRTLKQTACARVWIWKFFLGGLCLFSPANLLLVSGRVIKLQNFIPGILSESWEYCWWKKSCTCWYDKYLVIHRVLYIPSGAGFLSSTACCSLVPGLGANPLGRLQRKRIFWPIRRFFGNCWWSKKNWYRVNIWVVVSNIFYFHPYLGKIPVLTNMFERGWNHQLDMSWYCCLVILTVLLVCYIFSSTSRWFIVAWWF